MKNFFLKLKRNFRRLFISRSFAGNLFIVGAQKSGTTALHSYLKKHPRIAGADNKEAHFFDLEKNYLRGFEYYRSFFPLFTNKSISLDSTPSYLYHNQCAQRIHSYSPQAKIVILLREPVSRAFSAFNMYKQLINKKWFENHIRKNGNQEMVDFWEPLFNHKELFTIEYFLEKEARIINSNILNQEPSLMRRGIYAPQIERYVKLFGRENVLIIFSDELKKHTGNIVKNILSFAGLEPISHNNYPLKHVRDYKSDAQEKEIIQLYGRELFEKDREILINTYDLNVPW